MNQIKNPNEWTGKRVAQVSFQELYSDLLIRFDDGTYSKISALPPDQGSLTACSDVFCLDLLMVGQLNLKEFQELEAQEDQKRREIDRKWKEKRIQNLQEEIDYLKKRLPPDTTSVPPARRETNGSN